MGYAMEQLPKKVQKLVKKLADLQRKQVEVMRCGTQGKKTYEELEPKINEQFEKGTKLVDELFSTQFATLELGVGFCEEDSFADDLHMVGMYFTERYALDRMMAFVSGDEPDEDLLDAGTYLLHQSLMVDQEDDPFDRDEEDDFMTDEEMEEYLADLEQTFGNEGKKSGIQPEAKIVPLFGDQKKGKKK